MSRRIWPTFDELEVSITMTMLRGGCDELLDLVGLQKRYREYVTSTEAMEFFHVEVHDRAIHLMCNDVIVRSLLPSSCYIDCYFESPKDPRDIRIEVDEADHFSNFIKQYHEKHPYRQ